MSRTVKGKKGPGYEYWSRRPNCNGAVGKEAKQIIHSIERQNNKKETRNEIRELSTNGFSD